MKCIFLLSGDYIDLGKEEVVSLFDVRLSKLVNKLLIVDLKNNDEKLLNKIFQRLALTKSIYQFLFECKIADLIKIMKNFDWSSVYKDNFCVRTYKLDDKNNNNKNPKIQSPTTSESKQVDERERELKASTLSRVQFEFSHVTRSNPLINFSEKELASYIWHSLHNPKVDLENPKTLIQLFAIKNKVYCSLLIKKIDYDFEARKSHLRPFPHPNSLHPKIARALVNITGIKKDDVLLDPFCGTGGFLIEVGLMNIKNIGYDINKIMINGCIENLKHYKIMNYKIKNKNAVNITDKFDYVVTDLPYGLNSNAMMGYEKEDWKKHRINKKIQKKDFYKNLESFYLKFLKNLRKKLKKKAVIVFPDYVDYRKLLKKSKFRIEKEFSNYVHRSLTRKIVRIR